MSVLREQVEQYLTTYFLTLTQLAQESHVSPERIVTLIENRCIPKHSYVQKESISVGNEVFGEHTLETRTTYYYPRSLVLLLLRAENLSQRKGLEEVAATMKTWMKEQFQVRFQSLPEARIGFPLCFYEDGKLDDHAFAIHFEEIFQNWLEGVYGICVVDAASPEAIATKEVYQAYLGYLTTQGTRTDFTGDERRRLATVLPLYDAITMPFSSHEYPYTSRKRFIDDVTARLQ